MARDETWKPGHRRNRSRLMGTGKMSENRLAWVRTEIGQFVIMLDSEENELGTSVRLIHPRPGAKSVILNITALTMLELEAVEQFFKLLFDKARPVVEQRDKAAQLAYEQGDDSFARSYRRPPQFIVREGPQREHPEGVSVGLDRVPEMGEGPDPDGELRGDGSELAEQPAPDRGSEDDGT